MDLVLTRGRALSSENLPDVLYGWPQVNDHAMVAAWREGRGGGRGKGAASADSQKETVMTLM